MLEELELEEEELEELLPETGPPLEEELLLEVVPPLEVLVDVLEEALLLEEELEDELLEDGAGGSTGVTMACSITIVFSAALMI